MTHVLAFRPHDHLLDGGGLDVRGLLASAALDAFARAVDVSIAAGAVVDVVLAAELLGVARVSVPGLAVRFLGTVDVDANVVRLDRLDADDDEHGDAS